MNSHESQSNFLPQNLTNLNHQEILEAVQELHNHALSSGGRSAASKNQREHEASFLGLQHIAVQADKHTNLPREFLQQRNTDLEKANSAHLNLITELKIKVAVLENEVHKYGLDKEASANALAVVIAALARSSALAPGCASASTGLRNKNESSPRVTRSENRDRLKSFKAIQELELEILNLRGKSQRLSRQLRLQNNEPEYCVRKESSSCSSIGEQCSCLLMEDRPLDQLLTSPFSEEPCAEDIIEAGNIPCLPIRPSSAVNKEISASTAPKNEQGNFMPISSSNAPEYEDMPRCDPDYGMRSLSDLIDQDGTEATEEQGQDRSTRFTKALHGDIDLEGDDFLDGSILEQMKNFQNIPAVSVIQTGINIKEEFQEGGTTMSAKDASLIDSYVSGHHDCPNPSSLRQDHPKDSISSVRPPADWPCGAGACMKLEERNGAINIHQQSCDKNNRFPLFFHYEIQYHPQKTDDNYHRAVLISNLPDRIELREVLARVRGGSIINAVLADTLKIAGGMTALIIFRSECDTLRYVEFCAINPIQFPSSSLEEEGNLLIPRVTLLDSATYPQNEPAPDRSRCLCIPNFPRQFSIRKLERSIACDNAYRAGALVEIWMDEYMTLHLQFSSVNAAGSAFAILTHWQCYRGLIVLFETDPCAGDLEELLAEMEPRKSMFPSSGYIEDVVGVSEQEAEMKERGKWGGSRLDQEQETLELAGAKLDPAHQYFEVTSRAFRPGYPTNCASDLTPLKVVAGKVKKEVTNLDEIVLDSEVGDKAEDLK